MPEPTNDSISIVLTKALLVLIGITAALFLWDILYPEGLDSKGESQTYEQVVGLIQANYVEGTSQEQLLVNALKGMTQGLDPYSNFYGKKELFDFEQETSGRFVGIGILIATAMPPLTVLFPQPGSPAENSGLQVGDRIVAVDGEPVENLSLSAARAKIRGAEGSLVALKIIPYQSDQPKMIEVQRKDLRDPTVFRVRMVDQEHGIGYVQISSFSLETADEFDEGVRQLQDDGLRALIVDLRFNTGGSLEAVIKIANRFIQQGVIVSTRGRNEQFNRTHRAQAAEALYAGLPLILLINGESASASEVLAGAIQDHRVGILLGTTTYGKGVVQSLKTLADNLGIVKITTSYYYTPAHRNFEKHIENATGGGIEPDRLIPVDSATYKVLAQTLTRYEIPGKYRAQVEELYREQGLSLEPAADVQLNAAVAILRGQTPEIILK